MTDNRELDAQVSEKVMGRYPLKLRATGELVSPPPRYSTDMAAAWEVVEKMTAGDWYFDSSYMGGKSAVSATARFTRTPLIPPSESFNAIAATMPGAICIAALEAVEATLIAAGGTRGRST